jgi:hypothetical protein
MHENRIESAANESVKTKQQMESVKFINALQARPNNM